MFSHLGPRVGPWIDVKIRSEGGDDNGRAPPLGLAKIEINGKDVSRHRRGHNVAIIDYKTGMFIQLFIFTIENVQVKWLNSFNCFNFLHMTSQILKARSHDMMQLVLHNSF